MIRINNDLLNEVAEKLKRSLRGRCNYNFHKDSRSQVQRLLNMASPATYIQPHKHENPDKNEVFIILRGRVLMVEFDERGKMSDHYILDPGEGNFGAEIPPGIWHSFICLEEGSCLYEVKEGPYNPEVDKKFAPWAPPEGTPEAGLFNQRILSGLGF